MIGVSYRVPIGPRVSSCRHELVRAGAFQPVETRPVDELISGTFDVDDSCWECWDELTEREDGGKLRMVSPDLRWTRAGTSWSGGTLRAGHFNRLKRARSMN